jgi:hypothetical protein
MCKVFLIGAENGQFQHTGSSNGLLGMKILQRKMTGTQTSFSTNLGGGVSESCLSFFLSASPPPTYVFIAPTCTITIITFKPCALNAEFHHYILSCHKISLLCGYR